MGKYVEERIRVICEWKDAEIEELKVMKDHVHLVAIVPPKVSISELMGFLKGRRQLDCSKPTGTSGESRTGEIISGAAATAYRPSGWTRRR